ncbi:hypothetical protein Tco_0097641 [Tanacetum coccineum]
MKHQAGDQLSRPRELNYTLRLARSWKPNYVAVMPAPIISILSDSSEEIVGSHAPRVILFGAIHDIIYVIPEVPIIPADPIVIPEVGTVSVVSLAGRRGAIMEVDTVDAEAVADVGIIEGVPCMKLHKSLLVSVICFPSIQSSNESIKQSWLTIFEPLDKIEASTRKPALHSVFC